MTDINEHIRPATAEIRPGDAPARSSAEADGPADAALLDLAELLFFAYRDFIGEPDKILDEYGFGRAHHRVLHFVSRHPGLRVADLLEILKITKQSLGRVLKQLIDDGFIAQEAGKTDRRERLLFPTPRGRKLAERLAAPQLQRISAALDASGGRDKACIADFLRAMASGEDRDRVESLAQSAPGGRPAKAGPE